MIVRVFNTIGLCETGQYGMVIPTFPTQALAAEPLNLFGDGDKSHSFTSVVNVVGADDDDLDGIFPARWVKSSTSDHIKTFSI